MGNFAKLSAVSLVLCVGSSVTLLGCADNEERVAQTGQAVTASELTTSVTVSSRWQGGYCATIRLRNGTTKAVAGWTAQLDPKATRITTSWNGSYTLADAQLTVTPVANSAQVAAGGFVEFGFCTAGATASGPGPVMAQGQPVGTILDGLTARLDTSSNWDTGYCTNVTVTNGTQQPMWTWGVVVQLGAATVTNVWNASASTSNRQLTLVPLAQNAALAAGASTTVGFCASKNGSADLPSLVAPLPPPRRCGTIAGLTCGANEYCDLGVGACHVADAAGTCRAKAEVCTQNVDLVCGCDGKTYNNACAAAQAGMNVDHTGACVRTCLDNSACDPSTEYCKLPRAYCLFDGPAAVQGTCESKPTVCPTEYAPVCGCDGKTYSNECVAAMAGAIAATDGACLRSCLDNSGCDRTTEYCALPTGACLVETLVPVEGACQVKPEVCSDVYNPVCGCDGRTYSNDCAATVAGVSIAKTGACERSCIDNSACNATTEYCKLPTGACLLNTLVPVPGTCQSRSEQCPDLYAPICGCDGRTYGNECEAAAVGVSIASSGACASVVAL